MPPRPSSLRPTFLLVSMTMACADPSGSSDAGEEELPATRVDVHEDYPEALSSFGAAVLEDQLYVYSGHIGMTHSHSKDNLSLAFRSIDLADPSARWRSLSFRDPVQSASLVPYDGSLYRTGGMTAYGELGDEEEQLESVTAFERYDPGADAWSALPSLPRGRSSHDAVVVGTTLYVFGGWFLSLDDPESGTFYDHGLRVDLSADVLAWETIEQPFQRRALCVASDGARVYVVGGMDHTHQGTLRSDVYDLETETWTQGPDAPGDDTFAAFGCSSFGVGDDVYLTINDGLIYRLDTDTSSWQAVAAAAEPRFFTRLVPHRDRSLLMVAGVATMGEHLTSIEVMPMEG